jgi:rhodanese-related sulfurtransferase
VTTLIQQQRRPDELSRHESCNFCCYRLSKAFAPLSAPRPARRLHRGTPFAADLFTWQAKRRRIAMQTISAQELKHFWDRGEDFLLVNTLPAEYFSETKIPGAVNIPQDSDDFADRVLEKAGSKEKAIVVYCASRKCDSSSQAALKLLDAGFEEVWDFEDGVEGWRELQKSKKGTGATKWA